MQRSTRPTFGPNVSRRDVAPSPHHGGHRARRLAVLLSASTAIVGISQVAHAQSSPPPFTPNHKIEDVNGVSAVSGTAPLSQITVSIGDPKDGLVHEQRNIEPNTMWAGKDNFFGKIVEFVGESYRSYTVDTREGTYSFIMPDGVNYHPGDGWTAYSNAKLAYNSTTKIYTLTTGNGVKYTFDVNKYVGLWGYALTKIERPDGYIVNIETKSATYVLGGTNTMGRIQSVRDNRGYMLKYSYAAPLVNTTSSFNPAALNPSSIIALNLAVDYCNPTADTCSYTKTWPTANLGVTSGQFYITDPLNRTTYYWQTSVPGTTTLNVKKPGSTAADTIYTIGPDSVYGWFQVIKSVNRGGKVWTYDYDLEPGMYDPDGNPTPRFATMTITDPDSEDTTVYSHLLNNMPLTITNPNGGITTIAYGSLNTMPMPSRVTLPEGNYVDYEYDSNSMIPTKETYVAKSGSGLANIVISRSLAFKCLSGTSCKSISWEKDGRLNQTDFSYNTLGQLTSTKLPAVGGTRPDKRQSYTSFQAYFKNSGGSIVASGTPISVLTGTSECSSGATCSGAVTESVITIGYGPQTTGTRNNLLPVTTTARAGDNSISATVTTAYDDIGNAITLDGPRSGTTDIIKTRYDAARQVIGIVSPDPDGGGTLKHPAIRLTYTPKGLVSLEEAGTVNSQSDPDWTAFSVQSSIARTYDSRDLLTKETRASGGTTFLASQYSYDNVGRLDCTAARMNSAIFGSLPTSACTLGTAGTLGPDRITRYKYDPAGQLVQVRRAVGTPLEQAYVTYTYTANGKQRYVIDARGTKAEFTYDGFDRQQKWIFPSITVPGSFNPATPATAVSTAGSVNASDYVQYGYDANSNRTSLRTRSGQTINYAYDAVNRMTKKDLPVGSTNDVFYGYDLRGLQLYARFSSTSGQGVTNTWDALGRQTSSASNMGGTARTLGYQYDVSSNRVRVTHPDANYFVYDYDLLNRLTAIKPNGGTSQIDIAYDVRQRRASLTHASAGATTYGYDNIDRLTSLVIGGTNSVTYGFTYNPASQAVTRSTTNDLYAFTGYSDATKNYTRNGLNQYTAVGGITHTYDTNGNLTSDGSTTFTYDVENRLIGATGAKTATLKYDPLGRLWETSGGSAGTTRLFYDGTALFAEYNSTGTLLRRYIHGDRADEPLFGYEGSALTDRRNYKADAQGSIVKIADISGTNLTTNTYDAYGNPGASNAGRFQYTGQAYLPELGLYNYKARMYSSELGRFLQTDPIGYDDQMNLYAYVGNDPVNSRDPSGMDNCEIQHADGSVTKVPNCVGDKDAPSATSEEQAAAESAIITVIGQKFSNDAPKSSPLGLTRLREEVGAFRGDGGILTFIPPQKRCIVNGTEKLTFAADMFKGADFGGHAHSLGNITGVGPDDAVMARRVGVAVQLDVDGVRVIQRTGGGFYRVIANDAQWGAIGERGTQRQVDTWNTPSSAGSRTSTGGAETGTSNGRAGDKPTTPPCR